MKRLIAIVMILIFVCGMALSAQGVTKVYTEGAVGTQTFSGTSDGISVSIVNGVAATGNTTIASASATQVLRLMRIDFKPDVDTTGATNILIGSTNVYSIQNTLADNVYGMNLIPNFYAGALGEDLIINVPSSTRYNAVYRLD